MNEAVARRRRGVGLDIRPGAVREARREAGLSLAAVAGAELTRAAIHRVETGLAKPSLTTLQLIASRTGHPLSYFLVEGGKSDLDAPAELERLVERGEFAEALALADSTLADGGAKIGHRTRAHYWRSEALVRLGRPEEALESLEEALTAFRAEPEPWLAALTLHMKASALYLLDDPQALFVAESALRAARELEPGWPLLEARILNHLAALSLQRQETEQAVRYYEAAVRAAEPLRNFRQLSLMYEGLAMAYKRLGRPSTSRDFFNRALSLYSLQSDLASMARAEVNLAELLVEQGQLEAAEARINSALGWCVEAEVDQRSRSYALAGLGSVQLARGDRRLAEATLNQAIDIAAKRGQADSHSLALLSLGKVHVEAGRIADADDAYREAIEILTVLKSPERLREAHIEYAAILERQGRDDEARQEWKAAALAGRTEETSAARTHAG